MSVQTEVVTVEPLKALSLLILCLAGQVVQHGSHLYN